MKRTAKTVKLRAGWLARDVKRAAKRVMELEAMRPKLRSHFDRDGCDPPQWYGPTGE